VSDPPDHALVSLGDVEVGVVDRLGEHARFEPARAWAETPAGRRAVLGQQFEEDPYAAHVGGKRYGVPLWFEHLLPERDGPLRDAVAKAVGVSPTRSFPLLVLLGDDLPGAVRVHALEDEASFATVARRVREASGVEHDNPLPLRVSLAGVQFKISARLGKRGIAVPGWDEEGDWIVKFASQRFATLPENEFATMTWACASGLDVPEVRLEDVAAIEGIGHLREVAGERAFAIKRYDRSPAGRIHQEDFAQVLGLQVGDAKYEGTNMDTIVKVVAELAPADMDELLARIVFCVLCGNDDAHAKNWSLWYPEPAHPRLSPAYDLVSTVEYFPENDMALKLAGARSFAQVNLMRMRELAERAGVNSERAIDVVRLAVHRQLEAWETVRDRAEMPVALRELLDARLGSLPLVHDTRRA
jgi:serine/threonine-protein kinase HipA